MRLTLILIFVDDDGMLKRLAIGSTTVVLLALAACGSSSGSGGSDGGKIQVDAAFYPLQWIAEQVGGDQVEVSSLTPPGAEPHDLELTPRQVAQLQESDLVVKLSGFQAAVDDAAGGGENVFDVADVVDLDLTTNAEHDGDGHDEGQAADPHFWLDPTMLAEVAPALAERFSTIDPDHAAGYEQRADAVVELLGGIDDDYAAGLASCDSKDLVTSHEAFGYLARQYGLEQIGINGLSPEQEPSPKRLAEVADFVEEHGVTTIYFETLVPSDIARTVADETGAKTAVLDPIEGVTDESAGTDYPSIMASNLKALEAGQSCS